MSGMMFGADRDRPEYTAPEIRSVDVIETDRENVEVVKTSTGNESVVTEKAEYKQDTSTHFTQKMASFIEGIVKGFYEIIVQLLYQIVQLFY